jgi:signal transduction histidine kinase
MKKVALVFVLAVLVPSLVLAWLAMRSLRDQQYLLERQQSQLDQRLTDSVAQNIAAYLAQQQREFDTQVESLAATFEPKTLAGEFDEQIRRRWPLAEVGFCVSASGQIYSPPPNSRPAAQLFRLNNSAFLGNRQPVEVYSPARQTDRGIAEAAAPVLDFANNSAAIPMKSNSSAVTGAGQIQQRFALAQADNVAGGGGGGGFGGGSTGSGAPEIQHESAKLITASRAVGAATPSDSLKTLNGMSSDATTANGTGSVYPAAPSQKDIRNSPTQLPYKAPEARKVSPQSSVFAEGERTSANDAANGQNNLSKVVPAEAEFGQLIGDEDDGIFARFVDNRLVLMCWHRLAARPGLIFGAQLNLDQVVEGLRPFVQNSPASGDADCLAILDDNARPVILSRQNFVAAWKRPFVATEIGDALPHWEVAAYLGDPSRLTQTARTVRVTLGLLIAVLLVAIGVGSILIVRGLNSELTLARQKTDFVSNVSHELKTPLTSIRMFSELLADGRVADVAKQRSYLQIISAEAARLTRLINNVLDFSRLERGEKKYNFQACDLTELVRANVETFRPHLEGAGFTLRCDLPEAPLGVRGDPDALSQIIVNLLSNAEKYAGKSIADASPQEIVVSLRQHSKPLPHAEIHVCDRGPGVPRGSEEKIFEKFYRAHNSLSSGVQGSGLGLTIARQIARAHGGDVAYEPGAGGGSCFIVRLPMQPT